MAAKFYEILSHSECDVYTEHASIKSRRFLRLTNIKETFAVVVVSSADFEMTDVMSSSSDLMHASKTEKLLQKCVIAIKLFDKMIC
jgi:hypothetical protein